MRTLAMAPLVLLGLFVSTSCQDPVSSDPYELISVEFTPDRDLIADGLTTTEARITLDGGAHQDVDLELEGGWFLHRQAGAKVTRRASHSGLIVDTVRVGLMPGVMTLSVGVGRVRTFHSVPVRPALPERLSVMPGQVSASKAVSITILAARERGSVSDGVPLTLRASAGRFVIASGVVAKSAAEVTVPVMGGRASVQLLLDADGPANVALVATANGAGGTPVRAETALRTR